MLAVLTEVAKSIVPRHPTQIVSEISDGELSHSASKEATNVSISGSLNVDIPNF